MVSYVLVMLGGALGTGARFWMSGFIAERAGEFFSSRYPYGERQWFVRRRIFRWIYRFGRAASRVAAISAILHDRCVRRLHNVFIVQLTNTRSRS
jgi:hypothetical protein